MSPKQQRQSTSIGHENCAQTKNYWYYSTHCSFQGSSINLCIKQKLANSGVPYCTLRAANIGRQTNVVVCHDRVTSKFPMIICHYTHNSNMHVRSAKYQHKTQSLSHWPKYQQKMRGSTDVNMDYGEITSHIELNLYGIVCLIMQYLLSLSIVSNQDQLSFGLCMTVYDYRADPRVSVIPAA